uniref:Tetraspanin n=1 Tax=Octopus bimaculoides TaxID=37653 RepID=A0A0L8H7Z0_OCTBM
MKSLTDTPASDQRTCCVHSQSALLLLLQWSLLKWNLCPPPLTPHPSGLASPFSSPISSWNSHLAKDFLAVVNRQQFQAMDCTGVGRSVKVLTTVYQDGHGWIVFDPRFDLQLNNYRERHDIPVRLLLTLSPRDLAPAPQPTQTHKYEQQTTRLLSLSSLHECRRTSDTTKHLESLPKKFFSEQSKMRQQKRVPCCSNLVLKYMFLVFNFFFWISGIVLLVIGIWLVREKHHYIELLDNNSFPVATYLLIAAGASILVIGLLGCIGAINNASLLLLICSCSKLMILLVTAEIFSIWTTLQYSMFLLVIFLLEVIAGTVACMYGDSASNKDDDDDDDGQHVVWRRIIYM